MGMQSVQSVHELDPRETVVRVVGIPDPTEIIRIEEGQPYTVPVGKSLVITAVGQFGEPDGGDTNSVQVDGEVVFKMYCGLGSGASVAKTLADVPPHLVVRSAKVVEASGTDLQSASIALGYLVPE